MLEFEKQEDVVQLLVIQFSGRVDQLGRCSVVGRQNQGSPGRQRSFKSETSHFVHVDLLPALTCIPHVYPNLGFCQAIMTKEKRAKHSCLRNRATTG